MRKQTLYISCLKKGSPKKHIEVCMQCRRHKRCKPYQRYLQPELPFKAYRSGRAF